jgi:hypothetical protein
MSEQLSMHEGGGCAEISDCGLYRYRLTRAWPTRLGDDGCVWWVMLNPSRADATLDDPTIRVCIGFTKIMRKSSIVVVNLFAFRATKPRELARAQDPVGPENDSYLEVAMRSARQRDNDIVIVAWGAHKHPLLSARAHRLVELADDNSVQLYCLGRSKNGSPRHPLMLPYASERVRWP